MPTRHHVRFDGPARSQNESLPLFYRHKSLHAPDLQIRLFKLVWRRDGIHGTMIRTDLRRCPRFQALSYVWGSKKHRRAIWIDDYKFKVQENLYDFLREYRSLSPEQFRRTFRNATKAEDGI